RWCLCLARGLPGRMAGGLPVLPGRHRVRRDSPDPAHDHRPVPARSRRVTIEDLDEMTAAAEAVLARTPVGVGALAELGWEPAGDPADDAWRSQFGALFQAHGRVLAGTPALGIAVAQVITGGAVDLSVVAAGRARRRGD